MFGLKSLGFGNPKAAEVPLQRGPHAGNIGRSRPKRVGNGRQSEVLREIGVSSDDPTDLMAMQEGLEARFTRLREEQDAFVSTLNSEMPEGVKVAPWAMIPWSAWSQRHAEFLLVMCELFPVDPWNTLLLPESERGASALGLPQHLGLAPPGLEDAANRVIGEVREEFSVTLDTLAAALAGGDVSDLEEHAKAKQEACALVQGLAHALGAHTYGKDAFAQHEMRFGAMLGRAVES